MMKLNAKIEKGRTPVCSYARLKQAVGTIALAVVLSVSGCSDAGSNQPVASKTTGPDADGARAHVQQYVDQLLGGNLSIQTELLSFDGIMFTVETLEIVSSLPAYLPDGRIIPNHYRVTLKMKGYDQIDGSLIEKRRSCLVIFDDGKWTILGTKL